MIYPDHFLAWMKQDSDRCLLAEVEVAVDGTDITRYLSTTGYISRATDTPASTVYAARLTGSARFSRSLDLAGSGGSLGFGDIELDNADGELDIWLLDDVWSNRNITLKLGDPSWPLADFVTVFVGVVEDIAVKSTTRLALKLRDILAPLNAPLTTVTLGGDGQNKDALLPYVLGEVFNIQPLLITTMGTETYRVNQGSSEQIIEVRDNGYPISVVKDEAAGTFDLLFARWGQITCDVQGATIEGEYYADAGWLIYIVATALGDGAMLAPESFDTVALADFRAACPQPLGYYAVDRQNRLEIMRALAASVGATVTAGLDGLVRIVRINFGTPGRIIRPYHMVSGSFVPVRKLPVKVAVSLKGCKNFTPQPASSLAAVLTQGQIPVLEGDYTTKIASDPALATAYRVTESPAPQETLLIDEADVLAEADRQQVLWGVPRIPYRFEAFPDLFDIEMGETHTVEHPRLGLETGKPAVVTAVETDFMTMRSTIEVLV